MTFLCLTLIYSRFILAQNASPIPLPSPTENQGYTRAEGILEGAINGSDLVVQSFNKDWEDLASGNSAVYVAVVKISLLIAIILISFWSLGWYQELISYGFSTKFINELLYPMIVVLMLGINNGALLADTSLLFRGTFNYLNQQVLGITRNGVRLGEAIRGVNMNQAFSISFKEKYKECDKLKEYRRDDTGKVTAPRLDCQTSVLRDAEQQVDEYRNKYKLPFLPNSANPLDWLGESFNSAVQATIWIIFSGLESAFQFVLQASFILNAYIGPIFLVLSLLPIGSKPIYAWLSGWLALGLTLISYSILVGIAASSVVNSPSNNPLFFQLVEAILSPILALVIGVGGGMALFTGFTSAVRLLFQI